MFELFDTLWLFRSSVLDSLHTKEKKLLFSNMILVLTVSVCVHYIADFSALTYSVFSSRCENAAHIPPGVISSPPHLAACLSVLKPDIKNKEKNPHTLTFLNQYVFYIAQGAVRCLILLFINHQQSTEINARCLVA